MNAGPDGFAELLERARVAGAALGELLELFRAHLTRKAEALLAGRIPTRADAADAVQQTFLEAHAAFPRFAGHSEGEFAGWLDAILQNNVAGLIRDHTQVKKRAVGRERSIDSPPTAAPAAPLPGPLTSPSQRAMRAEDVERLVRALAALPDDQREAVRLRHLEGWPLTAIAERLDRTLAATAGLIKRGMQALRGALRKDDADKEEPGG
ncbi:MAG: sigma-70 family RNA polymerase sigma factor [Planctomycetes bacterium]|nr:sigma-70 family RNA polymerase sigma factor [Planctomycetota bacterium]